MSSNGPGPRPRQVTIGGWVSAIASVMLVLTVFDTMGDLRSVDTRDAVTTALTTGSLKDLGISVDEALDIMRAALFVAGAAAAATAILGIFVLQRHASARIALTIAAVPLVLTSPFSGGFLGLMVGAAAVMLWTRPARDWFAGRPVAERGSRTESDVRPEWGAQGNFEPPATPVRVHGQGESPVSGAAGDQPPPMPGWGSPPPQAPQTGQATPSYAPSPGGVPKPVRVAAILTWTFSGLTAAMYLLVVVAVGVNRDEILDLLRDNDAVRDASLSDDTLVALILVASMVIILWCLAASVLAVLTWRRHAWAWIALSISAGVTAGLGLLAFPFSLAHIAASGLALGLLVRPTTRAWFRRSDQRGAPPGGGGSPTSRAAQDQNWPPPTGYPPPPPPPAGQPAPPPPENPQGKPPVW